MDSNPVTQISIPIDDGTLPMSANPVTTVYSVNQSLLFNDGWSVYCNCNPSRINAVIKIAERSVLRCWLMTLFANVNRIRSLYTMWWRIPHGNSRRTQLLTFPQRQLHWKFPQKTRRTREKKDRAGRPGNPAAGTTAEFKNGSQRFLSQFLTWETKCENLNLERLYTSWNCNLVYTMGAEFVNFRRGEEEERDWYIDRYIYIDISVSWSTVFYTQL